MTLNIVNFAHENIKEYEKQEHKFICETCLKEFKDIKEASEHSKEIQHYTFKLKGTGLVLYFV